MANAKFLAAAAILGGIMMFIWGTISHTAIPWWDGTMYELSNEQAVVDAIKSGNSANGLYYSKQGVFAAVRFIPGVADVSADMSRYLINEFVANVMFSLMLAWILLRSTMKTIVERAWFSAMIAFASWFMTEVGYGNWYGFSGSYITVSLFDGIIGAFLTGAVIGWLMGKMKTTATA